MPREQHQQVQPPTVDHVEAVVRLLPSLYRLATLVLDATGMRVGELEALTWGDLDEPRARWRIATSKTGRPRWVPPPPFLLDCVLELCPRVIERLGRMSVRFAQSERFQLRAALLHLPVHGAAL